MLEKEIRLLAKEASTDTLMNRAAQMRDEGHGANVSYSRKVFIPLTQLCRDVCHYCTFSQAPKRLKSAYLSSDEVLHIAKEGEKAGCKEALFTLGDKPELRYEQARKELTRLGYASTLSYLKDMCSLVLRETTLLPHINAGVMTEDEMLSLREVSASQGLMLESASERLLNKGGPHYGSPDKAPALRLETIRHAGTLRVPFTSGILIGIGETREERLDSLFALLELHNSFGHIQEVIIQNFKAKPLTKMAKSPEPAMDELLWTIAIARLIFGPRMNIQAPPNLTPESYGHLIRAGLNDWGGISPVTKDFVNPEAPWPQVESLRAATELEGKVLAERLTTYPRYCQEVFEWHDVQIGKRIIERVDAEGFARTDSWSVGTQATVPHLSTTSTLDPAISKVLEKIGNADIVEDEIVQLFAARSGSFRAICEAANELRRLVNGDSVTYVVNRNINYTNICYFKCQFCAFSKGKLSENLRGKPYNLDVSEVVRRAIEAHARGATEVCLQGGIHPKYTGKTYIDLVGTIKAAVPELHIHAFSPLEVWMGAQTLGLSLRVYLQELKSCGLGTLPGTAAEILDDTVRAHLCPDKLNTAEWLEVVETAHEVGLKTTSTIMFGHIDTPRSWARHLIHVRELAKRTRGITEFVPLPFVHMQAPIHIKGKSRLGPTWREVVLMHAIARLVLFRHVDNIQTSWVKLGPEAVKVCLNAGANDLGGTLMNESISNAAGTSHGQEMPPEMMEDLIRSVGRTPRQRTTLYANPPHEQQQRAFDPRPLAPLVFTSLRRQEAQGAS